MAVRAAREIDALLETSAFASPVALTDHVMARIADATRAKARTPSLVSPLAWRLRAAADPASVLAMAVAGLLAWQGAAMLRVGTAVSGALASAAGGSLEGWLARRSIAGLGGPAASLGIAMVVIPAVAWMSWALFRWTERRVRLAPLIASRVSIGTVSSTLP